MSCDELPIHLALSVDANRARQRRRDVDPRIVRRNLARIRTTRQRLTSLVTGLGDWPLGGRVDVGRIVDHPRPFVTDLTDCTTTAVEDPDTLLAHTGVWYVSR